jgi:hypothetical protein
VRSAAQRYLQRPAIFTARRSAADKTHQGQIGFFLMHKDATFKVQFKFLDAQLLVHRIKPNPSISLADNTVLHKGELARYNLTRVELKTFTLSKGSKSLSIDSINSNPYLFRHYDITQFIMHINGKPIPSEGLTLGMGHVKTSVMGYRTLFEESGIHLSNSGLQVTHDMYIAGYFMLLFDLTPDRAASEGHSSHPDNGNIRIEARFAKELPVR